MSLIELKNYLQQVKIASLGSIAAYFKCDVYLLRQMLGHWIKKGCIRKVVKTPNCGSKCVQCGQEKFEFYQWITSSVRQGE